jgi:hypothetical protein
MDIWIASSALTREESPFRDAYTKTVVPTATNRRALHRALNHEGLRTAIDQLIKIPTFDLSYPSLIHWSAQGGATVLLSLPLRSRTLLNFVVEQIWAAILEETIHSWDRLVQGDDRFRSAITMKNLFVGKESNISDKVGFLRLSDGMEQAPGLWGAIAPRLASFEARWSVLMQRDADRETILHTRGDTEAVIAWVCGFHASEQVDTYFFSSP